MLEALRKGTANWIAKIFIGILVLSFAVWGVADIFGGYGAQTVATVGDTEISSQDYQFEFQREVRDLSNRLRRNITVDEARSMALDSQVLLRLIGDAAIESQAKSLGLGVSGKAAVARLQREDVFKDSSGQFSQERFYRLLQANGLSEQAFMERQHRALIMEQITGTVSGTGRISNTMLKAANKYRNETRQLSYISVQLAQLGQVGEPTSENIRDYYNTHKSEFRAPELRQVGVIALTPEVVAKRVEISEADIKAFFEHNKQRFGSPERRAALQIPFPDEATAREAYAKLQSGGDFMEIAKARGLTKKDVDLGTIPKSAIADDAVADAVFALPVGEISKPIEGGLATVIAKVTKIEPAVVKTLDDERENIRRILSAEQAAGSILDTYDKIEDERAGGATLAEIAKRLGLDYVEVGAVDARGIDADGKPFDLFAKHPRVLRAIFAADVGLETDPEETADQGYFWYEVLKVTPERLKSFEEVKDRAAKKWRETQERSLLARRGQELVDKLRAGEDLSVLAESFGVDVKQTEWLKRSARDSDLPRAAIQQAFALKEGAFGSAATPDGKGRVIFKVTAAKTPDTFDDAVRKQLTTSLTPEIGDDLIVQYVHALREAFGVNINQTVFEDATLGRGYTGGGRRGSF